MDTKTLSTTIVFAAITIALNPAVTGIGVPAPYAPYLIYQIWEIPIVAAYVLINRKTSLAISLINTIVLVSLFPGALPSGPVYNFIAILSMLLGVYLTQMLIKPKNGEKKKQEVEYTKTKFVSFSTFFGIILRVGIMTIVNYLVLGLPYPFGYSLDEFAILASLPLTAVFNATLALYTIPLGLFIAKAINKNLKL